MAKLKEENPVLEEMKRYEDEIRKYISTRTTPMEKPEQGSRVDAKKVEEKLQKKVEGDMKSFEEDTSKFVESATAPLEKPEESDAKTKAEVEEKLKKKALEDMKAYEKEMNAYVRAEHEAEGTTPVEAAPKTQEEVFTGKTVTPLGKKAADSKSQKNTKE